MKLRKEMVDYLAGQLIKGLVAKELIDTGGEDDGVLETISGVIIRDLQVEDELNTEVKALLEKMVDEFDKSNINYRKMFQIVKQKLARERGIIL